MLRSCRKLLDPKLGDVHMNYPSVVAVFKEHEVLKNVKHHS